MAKHPVKHSAGHSVKHPSSDNSKVNNTWVAIAGIIGIFLIVVIALATIRHNSLVAQNMADSASIDTAGQAAAIYQTSAACRIIISNTDSLDAAQSLSTTLSMADSTTYNMYEITVDDIKSDGCIISVDGESDFIATGQVQKLGQVYVSVKDIIY
jgi:hypothetical protein